MKSGSVRLCQILFLKQSELSNFVMPVHSVGMTTQSTKVSFSI